MESEKSKSKKNEIRLLCTDLLEDSQLWHFWYRQMTSERRKKIDAFRFEKDKRLSLAAGILLKTGIESNLGSEAEIPVHQGEHGKPFIREDLCFNLSHSGRIAVCAFSDLPVGVDIEENRHFEDSLIRYVYLEEEKEAFLQKGKSDGIGSSLLKEDPDVVCTRMWTIKESVMKYYGTGISLAPKRIRIDAMQADENLKGKYHSKVSIIGGLPSMDMTGPKSKDVFYITSWDLEGYQLSVCSEYKEFTNRPVFFDLETF